MRFVVGGSDAGIASLFCVARYASQIGTSASARRLRAARSGARPLSPMRNPSRRSVRPLG